MAEEQPTGRRERNKQANREAILAAGLKVFTTIGYDAATIRDIVRESGLSPGTFYNYFNDKETVFTHLLRDLIMEVQARVREARAQAGTAREFIADAFRVYFEVFARDKEMLLLIARNQSVLRSVIFEGDLISALIEDLESDLTRARDAGLLPAVPTRITAWAMVGAGFEILAQISKGSKVSPGDASEFMADLFLGGMEGAAKGAAAKAVSE